MFSPLSLFGFQRSGEGNGDDHTILGRGRRPHTPAAWHAAAVAALAAVP